VGRETLVKAERYEPVDSIQCPACRQTLRFYHFSGMGDLNPHFYCTDCSNVYFRESDAARVRQESPSAELLQSISATLPSCPCGGRFLPDQHPKCPHCNTAIRNRLDAVERLSDAHAVLLENAVLFREDA
jgi:hypothetical protein